MLRFTGKTGAAAAVAIAVSISISIVSVSPVFAQGFMDRLKGATESLTGSGNPVPGLGGSDLAMEEIVAGLKSALRVGTENVVGQIGRSDGFNGDPDIHIPLPPELQKVQGVLRKFGLSGMADEVELKLNRAAEAATPKAKELVWKTIDGMTLEDAKKIYDGPDDAATQYFKRVATDDLKSVVKPVVDTSLKEVGAVAAYDKLMGQYKDLPFVPDVSADLSNHAVGLTLDGLFFYLAKEEAAIRNNPAKRTTEILTKVFGK